MTSKFINLPPPPSDPNTPSEIPGTPNSGTTSLSALSTVAFKDGHQGHPQHSTHHPRDHLTSASSNTSTTTLDAERADRISRLAGLERVSTVRQAGNNSNNNNSANNPNNPTTLPAHAAQAHQAQNQPIGYFDATGNPVLAKERSTVGSASATGSLGGRTTWASGSDVYDADKMSEENNDAMSQSGLSDDANASLVGFGEGANSVVDGPISGLPQQQQQQQQQPFTGGGPGRFGNQGRFSRGDGEAMQSGEPSRSIRNLEDIGEGSGRGSLPGAPGSAQGTPAPRHAGLSGRETTERIVQERYTNDAGDISMGGGD